MKKPTFFWSCIKTTFFTILLFINVFWMLKGWNICGHLLESMYENLAEWNNWGHLLESITYIMVNIITYIQNGISRNIWGHLLESIFPSLALPTAGCLQYTTIQNTFTSYFWTCQNYFKHWKVKISRISKMSPYFPHSYFIQQVVTFNTKLLWGKYFTMPSIPWIFWQY